MLKTLTRPIKDHKCAIFIFIFIFLYNFIIVNNFDFCKIDNVTYSYHVVDYSLGFCTRLLPGAIYNAICSTTDPIVVNIYFNVLYHIFLIGLSFVLEKFINSFDSSNRFYAFIIAMFFITGPATFSIHIKEFGMLDTYWVFCFILVVVFLQNKFLKWFIPVLFMAFILIHYSALVSYVPFLLLFILFDATNDKNNSKSYYIIFSISLVTLLFTFGYFLLFEESNVKLTIDEFRDYIETRNLFGQDFYDTYYLYALYKLNIVQEIPADVFADKILIEGNGAIVSIINSIFSQLLMNLEHISVMLLDHIFIFIQEVLLTLPLIYTLYKFIMRKISESKNNKQQIYVLKAAMFFFPCLFLISSFFSPDILRWFGNVFLCLFSFTLYVMYKTKDSKIWEQTEKNTLLKTAVYFMFYSLSIVNPYY